MHRATVTLGRPLAAPLFALLVLLVAFGASPAAEAESPKPRPKRRPQQHQQSPPICLRMAYCQCWQGCVLTQKVDGPVRLSPGANPIPGDWYRLLDEPDGNAFLMHSEVCLLDETNHRTGVCFEALDMPACTGSCYPVAPGFSCEAVVTDGIPTSCTRVEEPAK